MSLQQNNISNFPKHLQHVRLQKEEEEEQWISGEELCTEGSSDEENTNDIKKKFKTKPIKLPSKDSFQIKKLSSTSLSSTSTKPSDEENTENLLKSPTHWRPKRGSIKLPNIDEKYLDSESEEWDAVYEYQNAMQELKSFKNKLNNIESYNNGNINYKNTDFEYSITHEEETNINYNNTHEEETNLSNTDKVFTLEKDLKKLNQILEDCVNDRLDYQKKVCENLHRLSTTSLLLKNTKKFYKIFKYKSDNQLDKSGNQNLFKQKNKHKKKSFWKRNKCTPRKNNKMEEVVLNGEEKARLLFLLKDIEISEIIETEKHTDAIKEEKIKSIDNVNSNNAFRATNEELRSLHKIEQKLKTLQVCDDADLKGKLSEEIYSIDEENREWKAYLKLTEERHKRIDEKINKLRELDELDEPKRNEDTTDDNLQET